MCKWCCISVTILFSSLTEFFSFPALCPIVFLQKLSTGHSAWTRRRWQRRCAGAPRKTCWGRPRATLTSSLHFMTLSPAETTRSASLKVNNGVNCPADYVYVCLQTHKKGFSHVLCWNLKDLSNGTAFPCVITEACFLDTWCYSFLNHTFLSSIVAVCCNRTEWFPYSHALRQGHWLAAQLLEKNILWVKV